MGHNVFAKYHKIPPPAGVVPADDQDGGGGRQARLARLRNAGGHARAAQGARGDQEVVPYLFETP